jgi:hypothetical protein
MAMKLLTFHDQRVADLSTDDDDDDFVILDIIQRTQVSDTQFELGQRIRPQSLDSVRDKGRLVLKSSNYSRFRIR